MKRRVLWLTAYAVAMGYLEAAVVVYLRAIYYPDGFTFPLTGMPDRMVLIEVAREVATIVMIAAVAALAGADRWERFLCFALVFGIWDILYYVFLYVTLGWPPLLSTPDILFLIPVPWVAPVLAPVLISLGLIVGALVLLRLRARGAGVAFPASLWTLAIAGGALVLLSFTLDFRAVVAGGHPPPFRWWLFGAGMGAGVVALLAGTLRLRRMIGAGSRSRS
jgi:hypothetical protein